MNTRLMSIGDKDAGGKGTPSPDNSHFALKCNENSFFDKIHFVFMRNSTVGNYFKRFPWHV